MTDWVKPGDPTGEFKHQVSAFRDAISRGAGARYPPEKGRYHLYVSYACPWVRGKSSGFAVGARLLTLRVGGGPGSRPRSQAHRTLIIRRLKGLEDVVSYSVVHWHLGAQGWRFVAGEEQEPGAMVVADPVDGYEAFTHLRDVYLESDAGYQGRFTVPVLYDKKTRRIVSNESSEIVRMLGTEVRAAPSSTDAPVGKGSGGKEGARR